MSEVIYPLIINSNSLVPTVNNNIYRYTFPVGTVQFRNSKVAVRAVNIFYSWFNIMASDNNNTYQMIFPDGSVATFTTYTITMPDGFYAVSDLNTYLQQFCITNGLYLIDNNGNYVYYAEFIINSSAYAVQFNAFPVPTAVPAGWSAPSAGFSGGNGLPLVSEGPQLIVPVSNFSDNIGFDSGTWPAVQQNTVYSKLSDFTPQITEVQSVVISASLINNRYSNPQTILDAFAISNVSFGSLINYSPTFPAWINVQDGNYQYFEIEFLDQNLNPLPILDTNILVQLLISNPNP